MWWVLSSCEWYISAVAGIDYKNVSTTLIFSECANKSCVRITILDDMTVERRETFSISLESIDRRITLDQDSADGEVTIMDNEGRTYHKMYKHMDLSVFDISSSCSFFSFSGSGDFE